MSGVANQQLQGLDDETPPRWKRDGAGTSTVAPEAPGETWRNTCYAIFRITAAGRQDRRFVL
jgi:hypothetical protein